MFETNKQTKKARYSVRIKHKPKHDLTAILLNRVAERHQLMAKREV